MTEMFSFSSEGHVAGLEDCVQRMDDIIRYKPNPVNI